VGKVVILTSKLGRFEFDDNVLLSHAKLIRDTVVGQWYSPKPGTQWLHSLEDVYNFMYAHTTNVISAIGFTLVLPGEEVENVELDELPKPPMIPVPPIWIRQALVGEQRPEWLESS
jgi:hypothetical protein